MRYSQRRPARRTNTFSVLYRLLLTGWCRSPSLSNRTSAASPFMRFYLPAMCYKTHKACEPIIEIEVKEARNSLTGKTREMMDLIFWCGRKHSPHEQHWLNSRIHLYVLEKMARGYGVMRRCWVGLAAFIIYLRECICSCFNKQKNE